MVKAPGAPRTAEGASRTISRTIALVQAVQLVMAGTDHLPSSPPRALVFIMVGIVVFIGVTQIENYNARRRRRGLP